MKNKKNNNKRIYLDYAAATPVGRSVFHAMEPTFRKYFANPGSHHTEGDSARNIMLDCRTKIARLFSVQNDEIIFTSGATEGNNMALYGALSGLIDHRSNRKTPEHIIVSSIEHASILSLTNHLKNQGILVTEIPVSGDGIINPTDVLSAITSNTKLVSCSLVNNEIGTIQNIRDIGSGISKWRKAHRSIYPLFHTDASQAPRYIPIRPKDFFVDLLTIDGGKVYGPKGIGLLFVDKNVELAPHIFGGKQEGGLRPGTQAVPLICGLAQALSECNSRRERDNIKIQVLNEKFITDILSHCPGAVINGNRKKSVAGIINISFSEISGEEMVALLDVHGVAVSSGSACGLERDSSHVVRALAVGEERAKGAVRFSFGRETTEKDIKIAVRKIIEILSARGILVENERS